MQEKILEVLKNNGPLKTSEISLQVGKKRAKEVQNALNRLMKRKLITKSKVNTKLQWSLAEDINANGEVPNDLTKEETEFEELIEGNNDKHKHEEEIILYVSRASK